MSQTIQISVNLFASFTRGRFKTAKQSHPTGTRIADIIRELGIAEPEVGIIMVNGRRAEPDHQLTDRARLALFPLIGGG